MRHSILLSVVFLGVSTAPAMAYIDPITGSIILQALIGGFAAAAVGIRRVRERILGMLGISKRSGDDDAVTEPETDGK